MGRELVVFKRVGRGNKPHIPTVEQRLKVYNAARVGVTQEEICKLINVACKTLRAHYRVELDTASTEANAVSQLRCRADYVRRNLHPSLPEGCSWP